MWGECWEIKDKIGGKKNSGGPKFSGGTFWGNAKKGVEKLFGGSKKWWGIFLGVVYSTGGILWKIVKTKFRGDFLGGVVYRGTCVGGMLGSKRQDREKKISGGPEIWGGTFGGNAKKGVEKLFWGECWGSCEPQKILGGNFWKNVKEKNLGENFGG